MHTFLPSGMETNLVQANASILPPHGSRAEKGWHCPQGSCGLSTRMLHSRGSRRSFFFTHVCLGAPLSHGWCPSCSSAVKPDVFVLDGLMNMLAWCKAVLQQRCTGFSTGTKTAC